MKNHVMKHGFFVVLLSVAFTLGISMQALAGGTDPYGNEDPNKKILKQGLLGAGVGAISAGASDGDAGKGALIGAGTNIIGGALLDTLTTPSQPQQPAYYAPAPQQQGYAQQPPAYQQQQGYYADPTPRPVYYQQAPPPPRRDGTQKILKQGLLGAGVGAISAGASDGDAGKGALIGAGANIIGGALLDMLTTPSQPQQPAYYAPQAQPGYYPQQGYQQQQPSKKIIRTYDAQGNIIHEEEVYE